MEKIEEKGIFRKIYDWFVNLTLKGLLSAILIVFIIILILMSVSFLPRVMSGISSSLSAALYSIFVPAENATITADRKIISSGEDFNITFKKGDVTDGIFTVSYACDAGTNLFSVENAGLKKIDCDTRYYLLENETAIKIRATTEDSVVRLVIEGAFENNSNQKIEQVGVVRVTIKNDAVGAIVNPPNTTPANDEPATVVPSVNPPYIPSQPAPQPVYYGKPDLAVLILQTGLMTNGTNIINNQTTFSYQDMVGVKFQIRNDGDANTGPWYFTATLPSLSTPTYTSNTQVSLRPGDSIIFTLGFSNLINQNIGTISVNADPRNIVSESVEYNNTVTTTITNTGYNNNYYNNNNYNNYSNGCYVNGMFTYNCLNNNYNNNSGYYDQYGNYIYYNNNNYYNNNLSVSCYADPNNPDTGDRVRWYANVYGGSGDYEYDWSGTNSLNSSSKSPTKTYSSRGNKNATVVVTDDDNNEATATCSVYVD